MPRCHESRPCLQNPRVYVTAAPRRCMTRIVVVRMIMLAVASFYLVHWGEVLGGLPGVMLARARVADLINDIYERWIQQRK